MFYLEISVLSGYGYNVEPYIQVNHILLYIHIRGIDDSPYLFVGHCVFWLTKGVGTSCPYFSDNQAVVFSGYYVQFQFSPRPVSFQYFLSFFLKNQTCYVFSCFS